MRLYREAPGLVNCGGAVCDSRKPPSGAGSGSKEEESQAMLARFGKVFRQVIPRPASASPLQGYLAHKKPPFHRTLQ